MRTVLFIAIAISMAISLSAQKGFEFNASFSPGASFILNNNDSELSESINYQTTFGFHSGVTIGYNFTETFGLATGLGFAYIEQNFIQAYSANRIRSLQNKFDRRLSYIRIPLLLRFGGNPNARISFFARIGPHIDFLASAISTTEYPMTYNTPNELFNYKEVTDNKSKPLDIFSTVVLGVTLDFGGKIRISDQMGLLILLHVESSLSNVDGKDAPMFFESSTILVEDPGGDSWLNVRDQTWNLMGGFTIGFQYTPGTNNHNLHNNKRRYRPQFWR
jgi:hypothetical protein